jgi:hypothetical protein
MSVSRTATGVLTLLPDTEVFALGAFFWIALFPFTGTTFFTGGVFACGLPDVFPGFAVCPATTLFCKTAHISTVAKSAILTFIGIHLF